MPERIAYLCGEFPRATDTFIRREIEALRDAGIFVRTLSIRQPAQAERPRGEDARAHEATLYVLPTSVLQLARTHAKALLAAPLAYLRSLRLALTVRAPGARSLLYQLFYFAESAIVVDLMRAEGLAHLHNHAPDASGYVTMIVAEMGGFTYSLTLHGHGILSEPARWRLDEKLRRALFTVCVSQHARSVAMLCSPEHIWERLHVIHCGVAATDAPLREHRGRGSRLLYVGRLEHLKAIPLILEAVHALRRRFDDVTLDIVGDGPTAPALKASVRSLGLEDCIRFHGYLGQDAVVDMLEASDILVMSSLAEGIPVALMEAMSRGLPVVAPRITGIPELVEDGVSGLLFPPADTAALREALATLIDDAALRARLGRAGSETVRRDFDLDRECGRFLSTLRRRLDGRDAPVRPEEPDHGGA